MRRKTLLVLLVVILALPLISCRWSLALPGPRESEVTPKQTGVVVKVREKPTATPTPAKEPAKTPSKLTVEGKVLDAEEEELLIGIYEEVAPSVVNIQVIKKLSPEEMPFGHPAIPPEEFFQEGLGSGFVWDEEGHIVTNNHVVQGADEVDVTFYDGTSTVATVIGTDPHGDIAVIKVDELPEGVHPVKLGDSDALKVGQRAIAIGNPFGLQGTMTVGIISGLGRLLRTEETPFSIPEVIQTDAAINPGNSGGPLLDSHGRVIGINTAIRSPVRASAGVGFAVPINLVKKVVPSLIEKGYYDYPWLGIVGSTITAAMARDLDLDVDYGVLVQEVVEGSPADKAGLRGGTETAEFRGREVRVGGDIIVAVDGRPVRKFDDLLVYLVKETSVGQEITLTVLREGEEVDLKVKLGRRPLSTEKLEPKRE